MTPTPAPTALERAAEMDVAAKIAYDRADYVFAEQLSMHAHLLRMEDQEERKKHDQLQKD